MRTLAKEFGLSDVGLAKVCRRHNIPRPGLGYWACLQAGQKLSRPALPPMSDSRLETIEIWPHEPSRAESELKEKSSIPTIEVSDDRQITHRIVIRIERSVSRSKMDERGVMLTRSGRLVPIKVNIGALSRTLRILDVFLSNVEQRGCSLEWPPPYKTLLKIVREGEKLQLEVTETIERRKHNPTVEEIAHKQRDYWWDLPRWDYIPTGRLKLTLESVEFPAIWGSWSDGKRRKLENCLGEMVVECERAILAIKRAREARAEAERRRIMEQKLEQQAAIRRLEYERTAEVVKKLSQAWQESNLFRDFATALQAKAVAADIPDNVRQELETIIDWTVRHAVRLNPLSRLNSTIWQFKEH